MTRTPREAALAYVDCLRDGDFQRLVSLHDEKLVCSLLGNSLVSGKYRGRDAFFAHTFKHVLGTLAETSEGYVKGQRVACADERYVALLLHGGLPTRNGGRYDQNYLQIFRVDAGLIRETHELLDTVMLETQVFGKMLATPRTAAVDPLSPAAKSSVPAVAQDRARAIRLQQSFGAAMSRSDWPACAQLLHPAAVLQIAGSTPASGTVRGLAAIAATLSSYVDQHFLPGSLRVEAPTRLMCADGGGFCRLANLRATLKNGTDYRQIIGVVGGIEGGVIVELSIYFDTAEEERQSFDNPLSGGQPGTGPEPFSIHDDSERPT